MHLADELEARRVPALGLECRAQHVPLLDEVVHLSGLRAGEDPAGGTPRGQGDAPRLLAAQDDRRTAGREGARGADRAVQRVVRVRARDAGQGQRVGGPERLEHLHRGDEPADPLPDGRQRDGERLVLALEPARAKAKGEAPLGGVVHHDRRLGHEDRVAERVGEDPVPDTDPRHPVGKDRRQRERLEGCTRDVRVHVREVVVEPRAVPAALLARERPGGIERREVRALRRCLERDPQAHRAPVLRLRFGLGLRPAYRTSSARAASARRSGAPDVIAPSDADETSAAYFAITPVV